MDPLDRDTPQGWLTLTLFTWGSEGSVQVSRDWASCQLLPVDRWNPLTAQHAFSDPNLCQDRRQLSRHCASGDMLSHQLMCVVCLGVKWCAYMSWEGGGCRRRRADEGEDS